MGRIPNSLWKWRSVGPKAESWQKIVAPPTELGNPHQTRVPTLPQRRRRRAADSDQRPTPLKSGALTDSCTEPKKATPVNSSNLEVRVNYSASTDRPLS